MKASPIIRVVLLATCLSLFFGCSKNKGVESSYTSNGVFWYWNVVGDSLEKAGTHSLSFYVDGQLMGTTRIYHGTWQPDPFGGNPGMASCGDDSAFTYTKSWKGNYVNSFNYSVKNQAGFQLWTGRVHFNAYDCANTELKF